MSGIIINFDTLKQMLYFAERLLDIDRLVRALCDKLNYDEQTTKKVLLLITLMRKAENWCSKDAVIQAKTAGILICMYNTYEDEIKQILQNYCEGCLKHTQDNLMSEAEYKYRVDLLMNMNKTYDIFRGVDTDNQPRGEWLEYEGKTILKLFY